MSQITLRKQQETTAKINALIEKSSKLLECGPTCQRLKVSEELKQKYLNAQTNVQTAPLQLEQTKRNYYIYTEGESYYNNMLQSELEKKADKLSEELKEKFMEAIDDTEMMNSYYNTMLLSSNNSEDLLNEYIEKNSDLENKLTNTRGDILTNDRKTFYEDDAIKRLRLWYNFYWYVYYILVFGFFVALFFVDSTMSLFKRITIFILILMYPYIIDTLLGFLYKNGKNIVNSLPKNVYNSL